MCKDSKNKLTYEGVLHMLLFSTNSIQIEIHSSPATSKYTCIVDYIWYLFHKIENKKGFYLWMIIQRMNDANIRLFLKDRKLTRKLHKLDFPCMLQFLSIQTSMCKCRQHIKMFRIRIFQLTSLLRERRNTHGEIDHCLCLYDRISSKGS